MIASMASGSNRIENVIENLVQEIHKHLSLNGFHEAISHRIALSCIKYFEIDINEKKVIAPFLNVHLAPSDNGWALISEDGKTIHFVEEEFENALFEARLFAKRNKIKLIIHSNEGWAQDCESFCVNTPA